MIQHVRNFIDGNKNDLDGEVIVFGTSALAITGQANVTTDNLDFYFSGMGKHYYKGNVSIKVDCVGPLSMLAYDYRDRLILIEEYKGIKIFCMDIFDVLTAKMSRYHEKKYKDSIESLLPNIDLNAFNAVLDKVLQTDFPYISSIYYMFVNAFRKDQHLPYEKTKDLPDHIKNKNDFIKYFE